MLKVVSFKQSRNITREKLERLRKMGFAPKRNPRIKPRDESEKEALCRAVVFAVKEAKRIGKLIETDRGYIYRASAKTTD